MGRAFHQLRYHFVWATHAREPHLHRSFRSQFSEILNEEVKKRGGQPIRHNAMPDHVRLLVRLPPTATVSEYIGQVKGATAVRVNHEINPPCKLHGQEGDGVLTLRKDEASKACNYIDNQEIRHGGGKV